MKINANGGHCPKSPGASMYLDELREDRRIKDALISALNANGYTASDSTSNADSSNADLRYQAQAANESGAELAVSVHLNAGGGTGVEVLCHWPSETAQRYASALSAEVAKELGIRDRGAKDGQGLYWIRNTKMTALLLEVCFVDNPTDRTAYGACTPERIAAAIVRAIKAMNGEVGEIVIAAPELAVDGVWGSKTTSQLQRVLGAPYRDGEVSRQNTMWRNFNPGLCTGWRWDGIANDSGSQTIKLLQERVGAIADGKIGSDTIRAMQRHFDTYKDGRLDHPSKCIMALQMAINAGKI